MGDIADDLWIAQPNFFRVVSAHQLHEELPQRT
jgi:hypothetical protein